MTTDEVLDAVKKASIQNKLKLTTHALNRMAERGAQRWDISHAAESATNAIYDQDRDNWRILGGKDSDGEILNFVVGFNNGEPRVVTILSD